MSYTMSAGLKKTDNIVGATVDGLKILGCLSTKRLIILNWKEHKQACFSRDAWLEEYLDLLNLEQLAC